MIELYFNKEFLAFYSNKSLLMYEYISLFKIINITDRII